MDKINHFQFNVILWNKDSFRFIGSNLEESLTVHWSYSPLKGGNEKDCKTVKSSSNRTVRSIENITVG